MLWASGLHVGLGFRLRVEGLGYRVCRVGAGPPPLERVPYYFGDLIRDCSLENYPYT